MNSNYVQVEYKYSFYEYKTCHATYIPSSYAMMCIKSLALDVMLHLEVTVAWYFVRLVCLSVAYRY